MDGKVWGGTGLKEGRGWEEQIGWPVFWNLLLGYCGAELDFRFSVSDIYIYFDPDERMLHKATSVQDTLLGLISFFC